MSAIAIPRREYAKTMLDDAIRDALVCSRKRSCTNAFISLLRVVLERSEILRLHRPKSRPAWEDATHFVPALLRLAGQNKHWIRMPEYWQPGNSHFKVNGLNLNSRYAQFGCLASHLFATHPTPPFMTTVWLAEPAAANAAHLKLYRHLAQGHSIRGADLPLQLTKAMARQFLLAPHHYSVEQALRWCQVRGLGASDAWASSLVATSLGNQLGEHEDFWTVVLQNLLQRPAQPADLPWLEPIVEYLRDNMASYLLRPLSELANLPWETLLDRVRERYRSRRPKRRPARRRWPATQIHGFRYREPLASRRRSHCWTIRELLDNWELIDEGITLNHCVASYAEECRNRETSIWSLQRQSVVGTQRVLTIEVDPQNRRIITALGKSNSRPRPEARKVLNLWAKEQHLSIACWV